VNEERKTHTFTCAGKDWIKQQWHQRNSAPLKHRFYFTQLLSKQCCIIHRAQVDLHSDVGYEELSGLKCSLWSLFLHSFLRNSRLLRNHKTPYNIHKIPSPDHILFKLNPGHTLNFYSLKPILILSPTSAHIFKVDFCLTHFQIYRVMLNYCWGFRDM
jgi:hypothetical protein